MIKEAINRILELAAIETITDKGRLFASKPLSPVEPSRAQALNVGTLSGLVDWIGSEGRNIPGLMVHIVNSQKVEVKSLMDEVWKGRDCYLKASAPDCDFAFGQKRTVEEFIINAQINFVDTDAKQRLIKFVSSISQNEVHSVTDDGISQTTVVRNDIGRSEVAQTEPIYRLRPFRTFREIEQPEEEFLLRLFKGQALPNVSLYQGKGVAWELEAVERIHEYLVEALPAGTIIIR